MKTPPRRALLLLPAAALLASALVGCAGDMAAHRLTLGGPRYMGDSVLILQGSARQVAAYCIARAAAATPTPGGCWIAAEGTLVFERGNWCFGMHEALHALGWQHGPGDGTCGGRSTR